jgi:type II secretory pathway pseudopilin PulG
MLYMKRKNNERGMILVIATVFVMIISILVVGFMSRNTSQTLATTDQIKRIQAEAVLEGAMWRAQSAYESGAVPSNYDETIYGVTYHVVFTTGAAASGPSATMPFTVKVDY